MLPADKLVHTDHLICDKNCYMFYLLIFDNYHTLRKGMQVKTNRKVRGRT